jgi:hypothetical protein
MFRMIRESYDKKKVVFQNNFNIISIPVQYNVNTMSIPFQWNVNTISIPFQYHFNTMSIPFQYHFYTISIPFQYQFNTISKQFQYHFNTISIQTDLKRHLLGLNGTLTLSVRPTGRLPAASSGVRRRSRNTWPGHSGLSETKGGIGIGECKTCHRFKISLGVCLTYIELPKFSWGC